MIPQAIELHLVQAGEPWGRCETEKRIEREDIVRRRTFPSKGTVMEPLPSSSPATSATYRFDTSRFSKASLPRWGKGCVRAETVDKRLD